MVSNQPVLRKYDSIIIFTLLTLLVFVTLYLSRLLDDNRLTSWQWVFQHTSVEHIFFILVLGTVPALCSSRLQIPGKSYPFLLFFLSFGVAAVFWAEPEVIIDASRYFAQAKHLKLHGAGYFAREWGRTIYAWTDLPALPFLFGLIFRIFGESRIYIQIFTTVMFSMTVILTYLIGNELWDEDVGFFGGLLLLGIPYLFTQVPLMLVDVPVMFFLTLSLYTFIMAIKKGGVFLVLLSAVSLSVTFFTKYSAWLMLSVLPIAHVVALVSPSRILDSSQAEGKGGEEVSHDSCRQRVFFRGSLVMLCASLFMALVLLYRFDFFLDQMYLLLTYQGPGLRRWGESFISTFFFQIHPFLTAAAIYSTYIAYKEKDVRYIIIIWLVMLVLVLQIRRIRYIIMVFPFLALMASYGIRSMEEKVIKQYFVSSIVMFSLVIALFGYLPFLKSTNSANLKNAGEYLDSIEESSVEVFTLLPDDFVANPAVSVPLLDLYTRKDIIYQYNESDFYQPWDKVEKSSLRFTWEYKNPDYYKGEGNARSDTAIAVISDRAERELPENLGKKVDGYDLSHVSDIYEDVFRFRTSVRIYRKK